MQPLYVERGYRRGSRYFHQDNYYYYTDKERNGVTYFRCTESSHGCAGRAILRPGSSLEISSPHNHFPNPLYGEFRRERLRLVTEGESLDYVAPHELFRPERNVNPMFQNILTLHSLGPALERARRRAYPDPPKTLNELADILRDERFRCLSATLDGFQDTLYCGSFTPDDGCTVLLFMSKRCSEFLKTAAFVNAVSLPFKVQGTEHQFYAHVLGTVWDGCVILLAWMVMDSNSIAAYVAGLSLLRSKLIVWRFNTVLCNDLGPEAEAYHNVFGVQTMCSLNDYINDLARKSVSLLGFENLQDDSPWRCIVNMMCVLPILPQDRVEQGMNFLRNEAAFNFMQLSFGPNSNCILDELLSHIQTQWLLSTSRGPVFSVCGNPDRTMNANQAICDKMSHAFRDNHSSVRDFYTVVKHLVQSEDTSYSDITTVRDGVTPHARRSPCLANDKQVVMLTKTLLEARVNLQGSIHNLLKTASDKVNHDIGLALQIQN